MPAAWIGLATGVAQAGIGTILGNNAAASQKKKADKQAQKTQKYNKQQWRYEWGESKRQYEFQVKEQEIQKRNVEANLQRQDTDRLQQWEYKMGIRDYQFTQEERAYNESVSRATTQKNYNQLAEEQSLLDQDRFLQENLIDLGFDEQQTMLDFAAAGAGLSTKRTQAQEKADLAQTQISGVAGLATQRGQAEADLALSQVLGKVGQLKGRKEVEAGLALSQIGGETEFAKMKGRAEADVAKQRIGVETELGIRQARTQSVLERQQGRIQALKAQGAAAAAGQAGRSARKIAQGLAAEAGAIEAAGTEQFLLTEETALQKQFFDVLGIEQQTMLNEMAVDQSALFRQQTIQQQLGLDIADIDQDSLFKQQNIQQQLSYDTMAINQKLIFDQQNIVQQLLFTEQDIDLDLDKLNKQLDLDKAQIGLARESLVASDANVRRRIALERKQADMIADASILLKPEIAPPLPKPVALPRPEWNEVYKPERPPEPIKGATYVPNTTTLDAIKSFGNVAQTFIQSDAFSNLFKPKP